MSDLPPEIVDAIIDELRDDKESLLQASLACRAFYPRTRVYLFSVASLRSEYGCDRLHKLITLSPELALHFKYLEISFASPRTPFPPAKYGGLTVIESLINVTRLSLRRGDWCCLPDPVASSLQSRSYRSLTIADFSFRSIGEICSLVKNSPDLNEVDITWPSRSGITVAEECNLDHSLHSTSAPVTVHINDFDNAGSARTVLKSILSSDPCPFSCSNIRKLNIVLPDMNPQLPQGLNQYLSRSHSSLKCLRVHHSIIPRSLPTAVSETLHVSGVGKIEVQIFQLPVSLSRASRVLEWWISNLSAVNEHCAIRSFMFSLIVSCNFGEMHPALAWEDLWTRLDGCLTSSKIALLERVAIAFQPRPAEWDVLKTRMEGNFVGLKQLGCEVSLNAVKSVLEF